MGNQEAIIVGQVSSKSGQGRKGLTKVPDGLPEGRAQFDPSKYFKVICRDKPSIMDENINDRIQSTGCHCWGGYGESSW